MDEVGFHSTGGVASPVRSGGMRALQAGRDRRGTSLLVRRAWLVTARANTQAFLLGRLLFNVRRFDDFCLMYAYLRWLDDAVDAPRIPKCEAQDLALRQRSLLEDWYHGRERAPSCTAEEIGRLLVIRDCGRGRVFEDVVRSFAEAIAWDARRRHTIVGQSALDTYSRRVGRASTRALLLCAGHDLDSIAHIAKLELAGVAAHLAHIVRDFWQDWSMGYWNISREAIERFDIDLRFPSAEMLRPWIESMVNEARELFANARQYERALPDRRTRLLFHAFCFRYERILSRVQQSGFVIP